MLSVTVLIPTYRRTEDLVRCLNALKQQTRLADEVLLIVRDTDGETWQFLETFDQGILPLNVVKVTVPGQVAALNTGLETASGDMIAITDDDAAPHPEWLERIEAHFLADDQIGGVGGRDYVYHGKALEKGEKTIVGRISWFGRVTGNHHVGIGSVREVDALKGVNMSYRREAIRDLQFDQRLLGNGAQVHNDLAFSLTVKRKGWRLIYDPAVAVDHFPAQRFDEDKRSQFNSKALSNQVHNETLTLLEYLSPVQCLIYFLWVLLIGTRATFGVVQLFRFFPNEGALVLSKWLATVQGHWQGWQTWKTTRRNSLKKVYP